MIKVENFETVGLKHAIRGMRNPKNSWDKSDSYEYTFTGPEVREKYGVDSILGYGLGEKDEELAMKLAAGGPVHAKYRRMIVVYVDITAPLYW